MNHYLNILIESLWVASIIPGGSEPTFFAMKSLGGFNMPLACAIAVTGATVGHFINYVIGTQITRLPKHPSFKITANTLKMRELFIKYGVFVLLLSAVPMFNLFVVLAGIVKIPLRTALPLIIAGQVAAYGFYLL